MSKQLITHTQFYNLYPKAILKDEFVRAINEWCPKYDINTEKRFDHFMAQVSHESQGFRKVRENLNYSWPRLMVVWPGRFPTKPKALLYARNPEKLANYVYGGRMGNTSPGDGWRYIARGPIGLTGKDNYRWASEVLGLDLINYPELVENPDVGIRVACEFWKRGNCNRLADIDDIRLISKAINGGYNGLQDRIRYYKKLLKYYIYS